MIPSTSIVLRSGGALVAGLLVGVPAFAGALVQGASHGDHAIPAKPRAADIAMRDAFGLEAVPGGVFAGGADYKVSFRAEGVSYTPALGAAAPRNLPLSLRFESVQRGGAQLFGASGAIEPRVHGAAAEYAHGAGLVERYDVRGNGIEQSFVFAEPLAGDGDLVVRTRLSGELVEHALATDGGVSFARPGVGGVRVGAVTGIDASGARVAGAVNVVVDEQGTWLELSLPDAFVDAASYPLVLDPWIGSEVVVSDDPTFDDREADVAYDASTDRYLVVWARTYSATDIDVRGTFLDTQGAGIPSLVFIETGIDTLATRPKVANVNASDSFLVVWNHKGVGQADPDVQARAVRASSGATSQVVTLATGSTWQATPDVAGDATLVDDDALVVFASGLSGTTIVCLEVQVPAVGDPAGISGHSLSSTNGDVRPAISKNGGTSGRHLVVWNHMQAATNGDVQAVVVDRGGSPLTSVQYVASGSGNDGHVEVDGNGDNWLVAWDREKAAEPGRYDVFGAFAHYTAPSTLAVDAAIEYSLPSSASDRNPCVAWLGVKAVIGFEHLWALPSDYDVHGVDILVATKQAGVVFSLVAPGAGGGTQLLPAMATQRSGDPSEDDGMLSVWSTSATTAGAQADLAGQVFEQFGPTLPLENLGGACGGGGSVSIVSTPNIGNDAFAVQLNGADPTATFAILNIANYYANAPLNCGLCSWKPFQMTVGKAVVGGSAIASTPIPNDVQIMQDELVLQWTVFPTSASPCSLFSNISVSNMGKLTLAW